MSTQVHRITVTHTNGDKAQIDKTTYDGLKASGMLWEFHPDAPADWPDQPEPPTARPEKAKQCVICEQPFKVGDDVYSDTAMQFKHGTDAMAHKACAQPAPSAAGTPRTDAAELVNRLVIDGPKPSGYVPADFARTLETELQAAQAELARLTKQDERGVNLMAIQSEELITLKQAHADTLAKLDREEDDRRKCDAMIDDLRAKLTTARRDTERIDGLRKLMGYVEDSSETTVKLWQDDATKDFFITVGKRDWFSCAGLRDNIDQAIAALHPSDAKEKKT